MSWHCCGLFGKFEEDAEMWRKEECAVGGGGHGCQCWKERQETDLQVKIATFVR